MAYKQRSISFDKDILFLCKEYILFSTSLKIDKSKRKWPGKQSTSHYS